MRWLFNATEREQINDVFQGIATGTKEQPMHDVTHCHKVAPRNESLLELLKLLPPCEREGKIHVTRRAARVEAKHMSEEHVTGHRAAKEIGQVQSLGDGVDFTYDGHGNGIKRTCRRNAKHA